MKLSYWLLLLVFYCLPSLATESDEVRQHINEILEQPDFITERTVKKWQLREKVDFSKVDWFRWLSWLFDGNKILSETKKPILSDWLQTFFIISEVILWLLLGFTCLWALVYIYRHSRFSFNHQKIAQDNPHQPLNLRGQQGLPDNILKQAQHHTQQQQFRQALSLLYQGALQTLSHNQPLLILPDSATEYECIQLVKNTQSAQLSDYFSQLTRQWQRTAYAQQLPNETEMTYLLQQWANYFIKPQQ